MLLCACMCIAVSVFARVILVTCVRADNSRCFCVRDSRFFCVRAQVTTVESLCVCVCDSRYFCAREQAIIVVSVYVRR